MIFFINKNVKAYNKCLFLIIGLAFLFNWPVLGQELGSSIKINQKITTNDNQCENDGLVREVKFNMYKNIDNLEVKSINVNTCQAVYNIPKYIGTYIIQIKAEGYNPYETKVEVGENTNHIDLIVNLTKSPVDIKEIVITTTTIQPSIKVEGNKTTYNLKDNDLLNSGNILEAVQKLPGVINDISGNILMKGKAVTIYIDGMPTNLSGQDLTNYLNGISAANVAKIEVINNPGSSFDANTSSDVINIMTNGRNKKGTNGTLYSAINAHEKSKFQTTISLFGLANKLNWNFALGSGDIDYTSNSYKTIIDNVDNQTVKEDFLNENNYRPFVLKSGIGFPITEKASVKVNYNFNYNQDKSVNTNYVNSYDNIASQLIQRQGEQVNYNNRNEVGLNFKNKFKAEDSFFTVFYQYFNYNRKLFSDNFIDYSSVNKFDLSSNTVRLDFSIPTRYFRLNFGAKGSTSNISSQGKYAFNNTLSNIVFDYEDYSYAAYTELYKKIEKIDVTAGVRYEGSEMQSEEKGKESSNQKFDNFFPSFNVGYQINSITNLNLYYSKRVRLPGYQELDPNITRIPNTLLTEEGNPLLKPSFSDNLEFKFSFLQAGFLSLNYSVFDRDNFAVVEKENGIYTQRIRQFDNIETYGANFGMPLPLGIITEGFSYASKIKDINQIDYLYFYSGFSHPTFRNAGFETNFKNLYYFGFNSNLILPWKIKFNSSYTYTTPGSYQVYNLDKRFYRFDFTLTKALFNNSTKIQFSMLDVFKTATGINGSQKNDQGVDLYLRTYSDTHRIRFSVTYNFGKKKIQNQSSLSETDERESKKSTLELNPNK